MKHITYFIILDENFIMKIPNITKSKTPKKIVHAHAIKLSISYSPINGTITFRRFDNPIIPMHRPMTVPNIMVMGMKNAL